MKQQFENASLVSVVNGSIVVKNAAGIEHTFTNASVVSVNDGTIIIESEWELKKGDLVKVTNTCIDAYCIIDNIINEKIFVFGWKKIDYNQHYLENSYWVLSPTTAILPVTPEEQKEFDDFCKSQGKIWNKGTLQWEKYKWKPSHGETFFTVVTDYSGIYISDTVWTNCKTDQLVYDYGNCFRTEKEAQIKRNQIKNLFKE